MQQVKRFKSLTAPAGQTCPLQQGEVVSVFLKDSGFHPRQFTGVVEKIFPKFAVVRVIPGGYRTTVHLSDYGKIQRKTARKEDVS